MLKILVPILSVFAAIPAVAQTCDFPGGHKVESARYVISYRTQPSRPAVGQHFSVELAVCPKGGLPAPDGVRVDGFMPEHNHGMNYKAVVKPVAGGHYEATGLMFHMPGKWDFIFEVHGGGKTDRMTRSVMLQ